jgi:MFS family permease
MRVEPASWVAWASLASACSAWMFDAMDLTIFTLVLFPSVSELVGSANPGVVAYTGGLIFAWKFVALGLGGIVFGVAADRIGRSATMIITVLIYSVFTGLSALAQNWWQLAILQALAGIGIGGEWAAGAALVAETWPERTRAKALIVMQTSFAAGFFLAALINLVVGPIGWRFVFALGAAPALITILVRVFVREANGRQAVCVSVMPNLRWLAHVRDAETRADCRFDCRRVPAIGRTSVTCSRHRSARQGGAQLFRPRGGRGRDRGRNLRPGGARYLDCKLPRRSSITAGTGRREP